MPSTLQLVLIALALVGAAVIYVRGWTRLRRTLPNVISASRLGAYLAGLLFVCVAIASPLAMLDHELLMAHMLQHLILMTVAAPLILLGAPVIVLLHGVPMHSLFRSVRLEQLERAVTHPAICWLAGTGAVLAWHVPRVFELGMTSEFWHSLEQGCFLAAGLLFWWPIVQPWPSIARLPRWSAPLYLFLATLPCDAL